MITNKILPGSILLTAMIFALIGFSAQQYLITAGAILFGLLWLNLETRAVTLINTFAIINSLLFTLFVGLAVWSTFAKLPPPIVLLGLSTNLAAWDLSRFRVRLAQVPESSRTRVLENKHLQKLALTLGAGLVIALLPSLITLPINFTIFAFLTILALWIFRRAFRSNANSRRGEESVPLGGTEEANAK